MIEVMKQAAREAGLFMINATDRGHTEKTNAKDFVTVADIKSQDILRDFLKKSYPDTQILSEEDDEATRKAMFAPNFTGFILLSLLYLRPCHQR